MNDQRSTRPDPTSSCAPAEPQERPAKARIHLIVGPVGAGKSTFAGKLTREHRAVHLNLDEWMTVLFRPERPDSEEDLMAWYGERTARCIEQIWRLTKRMLEVGTSVVLEIGLIERRLRQQLYPRLDASGHALTIYELDASRELRRERVRQRNREQGDTFSMVVPEAIFELASDLWEPLDESECRGRDVQFICTEDQG